MTSCLLGPGRSDYVPAVRAARLVAIIIAGFPGDFRCRAHPPPPQQITAQLLRALILLTLAESLVASMLPTDDTFQLRAVNILNKKSRISSIVRMMSNPRAAYSCL